MDAPPELRIGEREIAGAAVGVGSGVERGHDAGERALARIERLDVNGERDIDVDGAVVEDAQGNIGVAMVIEIGSEVFCRDGVCNGRAVSRGDRQLYVGLSYGLEVCVDADPCACRFLNARELEAERGVITGADGPAEGSHAGGSIDADIRD